MNNFDIIIIGSGISGLFTYYNLLKMNQFKKTCLIEKNDYYGGRIRTYHKKLDGEEYIWDDGAARFNSNHKELIKLIKELGLEDKIVKIAADYKYIDVENDKSPSYYIKKILDTFNKEKDKSKYESLNIIEYGSKRGIINEFEKRQILYGFPYNSEFKKTNIKYAQYLLEKDFLENVQYYTLKGGLSIIINELVKCIKKLGGKLIKKSECKSIKYNKLNKIYTLKVEKNNKLKRYQTKKLILALPKNALEKIKYLRKIKKLINKVNCIPLIRTYTIYPKNNIWFKDINTKLTTKSWLKYILPMNNKNGLIMISYTNGIDADNFRKIYKKSRKNFKSILKKELNRLLKRKDIGDYKYIKLADWDCGIHLWKKNVLDFKELSKKMIKPIKDEDLYIIGEGYSTHQGWIEGALESSLGLLNSSLGLLK